MATIIFYLLILYNLVGIINHTSIRIINEAIPVPAAANLLFHR